MERPTRRDRSSAPPWADGGNLAEPSTRKHESEIPLTRRVRVLFTSSVLAAGLVLIPTASAWAGDHAPAQDRSRAMDQHMRLMDDDNRGMVQMMGTPACGNMMEAPPFGE